MATGVYMASGLVLERGNHVEVCLDGEFARLALERGYLRHGRCESGTMPLVKTLAGLPGDDLLIDRSGIRINGILLTNSKIRPLDSQGRKITSQLQPGIIPPDKAFVFSEHKGGFDGRYFGLVDYSNLKKVDPLLTF